MEWPCASNENNKQRMLMDFELGINTVPFRLNVFLIFRFIIHFLFTVDYHTCNGIALQHYMRTDNMIQPLTIEEFDRLALSKKRVAVFREIPAGKLTPADI